MKIRDGVWLEYVRPAVLRVEAAVAGLLAAVAGLTQREVEVYRLECAGYSVSEISRRLMIQRETVRTHLKRLHGKLVAAGLRAADARAHGRSQTREGDELLKPAPGRHGWQAGRKKYPT